MGHRIFPLNILILKSLVVQNQNIFCKHGRIMREYSYDTFLVSIANEKKNVNANSTIKRKMNQEINKMAKEGWKLVSITPIIRGVKELEQRQGYAEIALGGWGFGYTDSLMITMEKQV